MIAQTPTALIEVEPVISDESDYCENATFTFESASSNIAPDAALNWNFGFEALPSIASGPGPHVVFFPSEGVQSVELTVDNNNGAPPSSDSLIFSINSLPESTMELYSSGWAYDSFSSDGHLSFVRCFSNSAALFSFQVISDGNYSHDFEWGDGSLHSSEADLEGALISHNYALGSFDLVHTFSDTISGCTGQNTYLIFNGSAPNVSFQSSGTYTCLGDPFEIELGSGGIEINYQVNFSDGAALDFTTPSDTVIQHLFQSVSCGYDANSWPNAFMVEVVATNSCSAGISTDIDFEPIFVSSAPEAQITPTVCPGCSGTQFELFDTSENGVFVFPEGCSEDASRFWTIATELDYAINSGDIGASNDGVGSDYQYGIWDTGSPSIAITVEEPGVFGAWLHVGNACGYDSAYYECVIQPAGELTLESAVSDASVSGLTICSGDTVPMLSFESSLSQDTIYWSVVASGNIEGIDEYSGSGVTPVQLPNWTLVNTSISSQLVEIQVGLGCDTGGQLIEIEVLPSIDIYLGPPAVPDTVCSGEDLFVLVNTTVHDVLVEWTVDTLSEVTGGVPGFGPIVADQLSNAGNFAETISYTFTTPDEACPADTLVYDVVVVPEFQLPSLDSLQACPQDQLQVSDYELPFTEMEYGWSVSGAEVGLPATGEGYLTEFIALNDLNYEAVAALTITASLFGCTDAVSTEVLIHPQPILGVVLNENILCSGLELGAVMTSSVPDVELSWTPTAHPFITGMSTGQGIAPFFLNDTLTNASNSLDSVLFVVSSMNSICPAEPLNWHALVAPAFDLPGIMNVQSCPGDSVLLENYEVEVSEITYDWFSLGDFVGLEDQGDGILEGWQASNLSDSTVSAATIALIGEVNGCSDTTEFVATIHPVPVVSVSGYTSVHCSGVPLDWQMSSTVSDATIQWESMSSVGINGATEGEGESIIDVLSNSGSNPEAVTYTMTTTGAFCAADSLPFQLTVYPSYALPDLADISLCNGEVITPPDYVLPVDSIQYSWSNSNASIGLDESGLGVLSSWPAINDGSMSIVGVIEIQASLFDCPVELSSFEITVNPDPQLSSNVGPNGGLDCQSGIAIIEGFSALGFGEFSWTGSGNVTPSGSSAEVDASGIYNMFFLDGTTGCGASLDVVVAEPVPLTIVSVEQDSLACFGDEDASILVHADGGSDLLYDWFPPISAGPMAAEVGAGTYTIIVTNASNCRDSVTVEMLENPLLQVELIDFGDALCGESNGFLEVLASGGAGGYNYQWDNAFGELLWGVSSGSYELVVTDFNDCQVNESYNVECRDEIPVGVSQVITPNGDGLNDVLYLEDLYLYPEHRIRVYNRWGTLVYESSPYQNDWQGTWEVNGSGAPLPSATYYYLVESASNDPLVFRGFVEIQNEQR